MQVEALQVRPSTAAAPLHADGAPPASSVDEDSSAGRSSSDDDRPMYRGRAWSADEDSDSYEGARELPLPQHLTACALACLHLLHELVTNHPSSNATCSRRVS